MADFSAKCLQSRSIPLGKYTVDIITSGHHDAAYQAPLPPRRRIAVVI